MSKPLQLRHLFSAILIALFPVTLLAQHPLAGQYRENSVFKERANPDFEMKSMMFAFQLQNRPELERLLAEQQDPSSPSYHHWLTPEVFGSRFGVSEDEYQGAVAWLERHGFSVKMRLGNRLRIYFDGSAGSVERAFGVNIGLYEHQGKTYYSNDLAPRIPEEFQGKAHGVYGLDNFPKEHPLYQVGNSVLLGPTDVHVAYNLLPLYQSGTDGAGQSIAIVSTSDFDVSDVQLFRNTFGLPTNDPQKYFVSTNPGIDATGGQQETLMDVEWSGAIAKGATIQVVIAANNDTQSSMDYIINRLFTTRVMSVSFGLGESGLGLSGSQALQYMQYVDSYFMQAASQGQTVLVASGDEGAQQFNGTNPNGTNILSVGADINYLCASSFVVCVGGTTLNLDFDASGNVTRYISETVWNNRLSGTRFGASGGGRSLYISKPSYQGGPGVPADGQRDVPDVAAVGDPGGPGAIIVRNGSIDGSSYGGTSLSAPIWAGVFALVNQYGSPGGVGWANPRLYQLGAAQQQSSAAPAVFNDVTSGDNSTPRVVGFTAGPGFDLASGWGSFNGSVFVGNFTALPSPPPVVSLDESPSTSGTIPSGNPALFQCTLNPTQYAVTVPAGALQLVTTLDGPSTGDVDLYVRKGQPVGDTGFSNPYISDYTSQGSTAHEEVYVGPHSNVPLTQGTYYIAVSNCMGSAAAFTLSANVIASSTQVKVEELLTDNGNMEDSFPPAAASGTILVNRLTPSRYPSTLTAVRVYVANFGTDPTGQTVRLVAFSDPSGSGNPPSPTPTLLVDQSVSLPGSNGFMEFSIANPPVIQSGDWYVGVQLSAGSSRFLVSLNETGVWQQAGFVSTDGGASFTGPYQVPGSPSSPAPLPANFLIRAVVQSESLPSSTVQMNVPALGSAVTSTNAVGSQLKVGYAAAAATSGNVPVGTAVISYSQNGIVLTEVGVPASPPTTHGRVFIDFRTAVAIGNGSGTVDINTGVALVNRGGATAHVTFVLRDSTGASPIASGTGTLSPGAHTALFVDQLPSIAAGFALPANFPTATKFGSLDISSDQPISILALRLTGNQRGDSLLTSTPIADMTQSLSTSPLYFSQFVDGGGYTTMTILVNTSDATETGNLQLFSDDGSPLVVRQVGGTSGSLFSYSIPPGGVVVFETDASPSTTHIGWAQVLPDTGTNTPVGAGVFSLTQGGILVTQSGIPAATPTTHAHIYVDTTGGHNTGLAIANPTGSDLTVSVRAFQPDGSTPAGNDAGSVPLSGHGHSAAFAAQFISGLPSGFTGVLDISAPQPFVALTLRSLNNLRGDFLLTTLPIADFNQAPVAPLVFPQIVDSGGYQTQIILLSTSSGSPEAVTVNYFGDDGVPIVVEERYLIRPWSLERAGMTAQPLLAGFQSEVGRLYDDVRTAQLPLQVR